jgi:hypothetical protein
MLAVKQPDGEAFMRRVKRYYSKTFSVPLPDVDDIPEEDVLVAFYEETFSEMSEDDRDELLDEIMMTPEERVAREKAHEKMDERDEEFMKKLNEDIKSGKRRGPPPERPKPKVAASPADPKEKARLIKQRIATGIMVPSATDGDFALPPAPPDIHMKFGEEGGNLPAEWASMDPVVTTPKK